MARNILHTMTFRFEGTGNLSAFASNAASALQAATKAAQAAGKAGVSAAPAQIAAAKATQAASAMAVSQAQSATAAAERRQRIEMLGARVDARLAKERRNLMKVRVDAEMAFRDGISRRMRLQKVADDFESRYAKKGDLIKVRAQQAVGADRERIRAATNYATAYESQAQRVAMASRRATQASRWSQAIAVKEAALAARVEVPTAATAGPQLVTRKRMLSSGAAAFAGEAARAAMPTWKTGIGSGMGATAAADAAAVASAVQTTTSATRALTTVTKESTGANDKQKGSLVELAGAYNALIVAKRAMVMMAAAIKPAMEMETAMSDLKVATALSAENIDRVAIAARNAAAYTTFTPPEAIEAAKRLNLAVRATGATTEALRPTLMMAQAFMGKNVVGAADLASRTMGAFNLSASELEPTLNKLVAGARAVGVQVSQLQGGMGKLGVAAGRVGSNFEDIYPAYLLAIKGGLSAEEAGTGLKTALGRIADPKVRSQLASTLGMTGEMGGRFQSVRDIMLGLAQASETTGLSQVAFSQAIGKAFGDRAIKPIMINIDKINKGVLDQNGNLLKGAAAYDFVSSSMQNSSGMLTAASEEAMAPMSAQLERLMETLKSLAEVALMPLLKVLTPVANALGTVMEKVRALFTDFGPLSTVISTVFNALAGGVGALLLLVGGLMAVGAIVRIATVAFNFLGQSAGVGLAANLQTSALGLKKWATSAREAAAAGKGVGEIMKGFGGVAMRLVGVVSAVVLVFDLLKTAWNAISKKFDLGHGKKMAEKFQGQMQTQFYSATSAQVQAITSNIQSITALRQTSQSLEAVVSRLEAAEKAKMPVLSMGMLDTMSAKLNKLHAAGEISGDGFDRMSYKLNVVRQVMDKAAAGMQPTQDEVKGAADAMGMMTLGFKSVLPLDYKFTQNLEQMTKHFGTALQGSEQAAMGLALIGGRGAIAKEKLNEAANARQAQLSSAQMRSVAYDAENLRIKTSISTLQKWQKQIAEGGGMSAEQAADMRKRAMELGLTGGAKKALVTTPALSPTQSMEYGRRRHEGIPLGVQFDTAIKELRFELGVLKTSAVNLQGTTGGLGERLKAGNFWRGLMGEGPQAQPTAATASSPVAGAAPPTGTTNPAGLLQAQIDQFLGLRSDIKSGIGVTVKNNMLNVQGELQMHAEGEADKQAGRVFMKASLKP